MYIKQFSSLSLFYFSLFYFFVKEKMIMGTFTHSVQSSFLAHAHSIICQATFLCFSYEMTARVSCLHGSWEDGVCKCQKGYVTEFVETQLYPIYCSKKEDAIILNLRKGFEPYDILHYSTMSVLVEIR